MFLHGISERSLYVLFVKAVESQEKVSEFSTFATETEFSYGY